MNDVGMNLAQGDQGPGLLCWSFSRKLCTVLCRSQLKQERFAIALDGGFVVLFGEAKIERLPAVDAGEPTGAGRKSMEEPGKFTQLRSAKNVKFVLLGDTSRHVTMLTDSSSADRVTVPRRKLRTTYFGFCIAQRCRTPARNFSLSSRMSFTRA